MELVWEACIYYIIQFYFVHFRTDYAIYLKIHDSPRISIERACMVANNVIYSVNNVAQSLCLRS